MKKILIQKDFYKSVPLQRRTQVQMICEKIEEQLNKSDKGIFGTFLASQTRKFCGKNHLFKFRTNDGDRIIFTYTKYLPNFRDEYEEGIYLIEYVSHDKQQRKAKNFNENQKHKIGLQGNRENIIVEIEEAYEAEYDQYNKYLNLDETIVYVINEDELSRLFQQDNELLDVYISNQQYQCVCDMDAAILMGGAGSGKTLVSLHKLNSYMKREGKTAYFTYSEGLKQKSQKLFSKIAPNNEDVHFYTLKEYCLESLGLKDSQFIDFIWFSKNFHMIKKDMVLPPYISPIDVWAEIRGIIKGYMWDNWVRNFPCSFLEINEISRKVLENKYQYITKYKNDQRQIRCEDTRKERLQEIINRLNDDEEIMIKDKKIIIKDINKIFDLSTIFQYKKIDENSDKRILPLDAYLDLSEEVSIYSKDDRRIIHKLCMNYQRHMDSKKLYDDNDLAGFCLMGLIKEPHKKFEYLVVDEVQDLTELQLFFLYNLVEDKNNILFAGDIHQIINPTYFRSSRLKKLFLVNNNKLNERYLTKNYRSQKNIIDLANKLAYIRGRYIARRNEESEQLEQAVNDGHALFYLHNNIDNLRQILLTINEKANAAVIVADEEDKIYLQKVMGIQANNIYVITEIKGLEFEYIFCYNLIGKYSRFWDDIFNDKAKKNAKYRYYFNIFYVAITRAKKYLCIYNEEENALLKGEISQSFENVVEYDAERLYLEREDKEPDYWKIRAEELEEAENFEKAILAYKKAKMDNRNVLRCEAKLQAKEKNYCKAIETMLRIEEYQYAKKFAEDSGHISMFILSSILSGDGDYKKLEKEYGRDYIGEVLVNNLENHKFAEQITYNYIENHILANMLCDIDKINENIDIIMGA